MRNRTHLQLGALRQGAGEQDALAFAAGQGGEVPVGQGAGAAAVDGVGDGPAVLGAVPAQQAVVRGAAEGDDLGDGQAGRAASGVLEHGGGTAGGGTGGQGPYVVPADADHAEGGAQGPASAGLAARTGQTIPASVVARSSASRCAPTKPACQ